MLTNEKTHMKSSDDVWLGNQIRTLRKRQKLSIDAMASAIGRSAGFLSQLERGMSKPTVDDLMRIAVVLDVPQHMFFSPAKPDERGVVARAADRRVMRFANGITDYLLSPGLGNEAVVYLTVMEPGADTGEEGFSQSGEETGYVIEGKLELWVGKQKFELDAGDCFCFSSTTPHRCRNPGQTLTRLVGVHTERSA